VTIDRDAIVVEAGRFTSMLTDEARVVHTDRRVVLLKARLGPPWFNTFVLLHDDKVAGNVSAGFRKRDRLRKSLKAAGYDVEEVTRFSPGGPVGPYEAPLAPS
jgi:hypothetical protein